MTEDDTSISKMIIYGLGIAVVALFAYMIYRDSRMQPLTQQPLSQQPLSQNQIEIQLMDQKLSLLENKIDNISNLINEQYNLNNEQAGKKLISMNSMDQINIDIKNRFNKAPSFFGMQ